MILSSLHFSQEATILQARRPDMRFNSVAMRSIPSSSSYPTLKPWHGLCSAFRASKIICRLVWFLFFLVQPNTQISVSSLFKVVLKIYSPLHHLLVFHCCSAQVTLHLLSHRHHPCTKNNRLAIIIHLGLLLQSTILCLPKKTLLDISAIGWSSWSQHSTISYKSLDRDVWFNGRKMIIITWPKRNHNLSPKSLLLFLVSRYIYLPLVSYAMVDDARCNPIEPQDVVLTAEVETFME